MPALLLAGCSSSGSDGGDRPRRSTTTTTTEAPSTTTTAVPFDGTTGPTSLRSTRTDTALLRMLDVRSDPVGDHVDFNFLGTGVPKVDLAYVEKAVADASGERIDVAGDAILRVRFEPAATEDLRGEKPVPVYQGADRTKGTGPVVTEVVKGGSFEGVLTFFVGVRGRAPYRAAADGSVVSLVFGAA